MSGVKRLKVTTSAKDHTNGFARVNRFWERISRLSESWGPGSLTIHWGKVLQGRTIEYTRVGTFDFAIRVDVIRDFVRYWNLYPSHLAFFCHGRDTALEYYNIVLNRLLHDGKLIKLHSLAVMLRDLGRAQERALFLRQLTQLTSLTHLEMCGPRYQTKNFDFAPLASLSELRFLCLCDIEMSVPNPDSIPIDLLSMFPKLTFLWVEGIDGGMSKLLSPIVAQSSTPLRIERLIWKEMDKKDAIASLLRRMRLSHPPSPLRECYFGFDPEPDAAICHSFYDLLFHHADTLEILQLSCGEDGLEKVLRTQHGHDSLTPDIFHMLCNRQERARKTHNRRGRPVCARDGDGIVPEDNALRITTLVLHHVGVHALQDLTCDLLSAFPTLQRLIFVDCGSIHHQGGAGGALPRKPLWLSSALKRDIEALVDDHVSAKVLFVSRCQFERMENL